MFKFKEYDFKSFSLSIMLVIMSLGGVGMFLIQRLEDGEDNLFEKQVVGFVAGIIIAIIISTIDYHFICKFFVPLYMFNLLLLLFCRYTNKNMGLPIYGYNHFEAKRWIKIEVAGRSQEFMPSELTKLIMILVIAKVFDMLQKQVGKIYVLLVTSILMGIPTFLIYKQPNLSTTIVFVLFFAVMVLAAGVSYKILIPIIIVGVPLFFGLFWYVQQDYQILLTPYQKGRIMAVVDPENYSDNLYQQQNAAIAIQSGGMFGKLLTGDTSPRGTRLVPVSESDFIFSAVGEEFGFIGMSVMIFGFLLFCFLGLRIARRAKDYLGMLIAVGITALIAIQAFVNIGVVTSLLPNTGIPLPFVSSGLSSLLATFLVIGILLNISMQPKNFDKEEPLVSHDLFYIA